MKATAQSVTAAPRTVKDLEKTEVDKRKVWGMPRQSPGLHAGLRTLRLFLYLPDRSYGNGRYRYLEVYEDLSYP